MKVKFYIIIFLYFFCNIQKEREVINFYELPFSFKTKFHHFLWQNFYKKDYETLLEKFSEEITNSLPNHLKLAQLIHIGISGKKLNNEIEKLLKEIPVGGIILFKANIESKEQLSLLLNDLQKLSIKNSQLPLLFSVDQEGGRVERISFITDFTSAMAIGQTKNSFYAWISGFITGYETDQLGIHFIFAPVADINNNPLNPVINTRSFGSTKYIVSQMVVNYIQGISLTNSIGFLKHFPGHGDTNIDSHHNLPVIDKTEEELMNFELYPFIKGIKNHAKGIMVGHILFPKIDSYPSSLSSIFINELLKKKLKFDGLVITDAMEMKAAIHQNSIEDSSLKSFLAGSDIILLTAQNDNVIKIYKKLLESFQNQVIKEERLNESIKKQIKYKLYSGLFDNDLLLKYNLNNKEILKYWKLFNFKKELSKNIYNEIKNLYPNIEEKIAYDSIRSLYKDFKGIENSYTYIFINDPIYKEALENFGNLSNIEILYKSNFNIKNLNKDINVVYEINSINEWNQIANQDFNYKSLIGIYTGNPFEKIILKENQYFVVSFSPTKSAKKAIIKRVLQDTIPQADLILPELFQK